MIPQQPEPRFSVGFSERILETFRALPAYRSTAVHALNLGLRPESLLHYVRGALDERERQDIQHLLAYSPWASARVVALVKAKRDPASLGARILSATHTNPYDWGMKTTGDWDTDLCRLLEQV
jgi:hypothetical protein